MSTYFKVEDFENFKPLKEKKCLNLIKKDLECFYKDFVKILKETTSTCPKCKMEVAKRLSQITGIIESVPVEEADVV